MMLARLDEWNEKHHQVAWSYSLNKKIKGVIIIELLEVIMVILSLEKVSKHSAFLNKIYIDRNHVSGAQNSQKIGIVK